MRLEDLLIRYLPRGGSLLDARSELSSSPLSFSVDAGIRIVADGPADLVLGDAAATAAPPSAGTAWTVLVSAPAPDEVPIPDILAWASASSAQLVDIAAIQSPRCTAAVVAHADEALIPVRQAAPDRAGDTAAWKRLAGELVGEQFRNAALAEAAARAADAAEAERRKAAEARSRLRSLRKRLGEDHPKSASARLRARLPRRGR
jgi:hypothetical protein